jgi:hypothetical protein
MRVTVAAIFACIDADHDTQIDTVLVDVVGPPPVGRPEVIEPANRLNTPAANAAPASGT